MCVKQLNGCVIFEDKELSIVKISFVTARSDYERETPTILWINREDVTGHQTVQVVSPEEYAGWIKVDNLKLAPNSKKKKFVIQRHVETTKIPEI
eukprot:UN31253